MGFQSVLPNEVRGMAGSGDNEHSRFISFLTPNMETQTPFIVRPLNKQLFQIHSEQSHPRLSLRRVLYMKFLRWVDKTPNVSLIWTATKMAGLLVLLGIILAPSFMLGVLTASAKWNGFRLPICVGTVLFVLNAARLWKFSRRSVIKIKFSKSNQHTYHGIPIDQMSTYLCTKGKFTMDAMKDLGLAQRKWAKIAGELEHHGVLIRGENFARVLSQIDRETLVRQLRDNFPLSFDDHTNTWIEKRGTYERYLAEQERNETKKVATVEKLERKEDKLKGRIEKLREEQSAFQNIMALAGA